MAKIALDEGIGDEPPVEKLSEKCRQHKREYYDARLRPWADHSTALAHVFGEGSSDWTPIKDIKQALMASDDFGNPVDNRSATAIIQQLCVNGYLERRAGACRPVLPSLSSYFKDIERNLAPTS